MSEVGHQDDLKIKFEIRIATKACIGVNASETYYGLGTTVNCCRCDNFIERDTG